VVAVALLFQQVLPVLQTKALLVATAVVVQDKAQAVAAVALVG
jgi:hypothetical protein